MGLITQWSRENFIDQGLYLEVLAGNLAARKFYDALGATHQETQQWQPPGDQEKVNELLYVWKSVESLLAKIG